VLEYVTIINFTPDYTCCSVHYVL